MKTDIIPNRLEKHMAFFFFNLNLIFIDSMQFMNSNLEKLAKNFSDDDFKYLTKKFGFKNSEFIKQKDAYPYEYIDSFKRFRGEKLPHKKYFYSPVKDGTTGDNRGKLDDHISNADYLTCKKSWNEFNIFS